MTAALVVATLLLSAGSAVYQSRQQAGQQRTQARVEKRNADIASQNARAASDEALAAHAMRRRSFERFRQSQISAAVAQGLTPESVVDLLNDSALEHKVEQANTLYRGSRESAAHNERAVSSRFQSSILSSAAKSTITAGYITAGAELAGGASDYALNKPKTE